MTQPFSYVRETYGVPAKRGMRVKMDGNLGKIISDAGAHIKVRFDSGRKGYCHPTWEMKYFDREGNQIWPEVHP